MLAFLISAAPAHADESTLLARLDALVVSNGLTADAAAARAAAVDPSVRRREAVIREREANVASADLAYIPQVTASLGYTRLSRVTFPQLAPGVTIPQILDNYSMKLELAIPLSDYFLRFPALVDAAELRAEAARVDVQAAQLQSEVAARRVYWQWVRAQLRVIVSEQSLTQVKAVVGQMQARVDAQRASKADLLRLTAQAAEVERGVFATKSQADVALRQLRQAIGAGPNEVLVIGEDVFATPPLTGMNLSVEEQVKTAMAQRSEVAALDLAIRSLTRSMDATRAALFPRLDAFAQANYDNPNSRVIFSGAEFNGSWAAGAKITWNLNGFLGVDPALDATSAQVVQLEADRENIARQLEIGVANIVSGVQIAVETRRTAGIARAAAEESYRMRMALLASDRATAVEIIDAETELTRTRIQEVDALIDLRVALAELRFALGEKL